MAENTMPTSRVIIRLGLRVSRGPMSLADGSHVSETDVSTAPRPLLLADGRPAADAWSLDPALRHLNHGSFGAVPLVAQERQNALRAEMERAPVVGSPSCRGGSRRPGPDSPRSSA